MSWKRKTPQARRRAAHRQEQLRRMYQRAYPSGSLTYQQPAIGSWVGVIMRMPGESWEQAWARGRS